MEESSPCKETCINKINEKIGLLFTKSGEVTMQQERLDGLRKYDLELRARYQQVLRNENETWYLHSNTNQTEFTMAETSNALHSELYSLCLTIDQATKNYFQLLSEYLSICSDLLSAINECKNCIG